MCGRFYGGKLVCTKFMHSTEGERHMRSLAVVVSAAVYTMSPLAGFAQESGGTAIDSKGRQVDEIFVVAQKKGRAENLQEVPAAITAYNADQLDGIQFQKLDDLSYSIPNVQLEQVGTFPGVQNFSIRGQGINSSIPSVDPTVGVFIDGVYQGTTYGTVLDTWDLESVEILRGPQGLLFGRNVTGGAVTVRTARPDPSGEMLVKAKVSATNEDRYGAAVAFESPFIQDVLAGKIMLYYDNDDGYFVNNNSTGAIPIPPFAGFDPVTGPPGTAQRNGGKLETKIARPTLVWTPSDELEFALIAEFGEAEGDGATWTVVDGTATSSALGIGSVRGGTQPKFSTTSNEYGFADVEWSSATLEFNWDIWGGTLTNIFGWKDVEQASVTDVDGTNLPAFLARGATEQDQVSNELRFATTFNDMWDMTVGVYYLTQDQKYRESRFIDIDTGTLMPAPGFSRIALGGDMTTDTWGIFLNNDIQIADDWMLTAGIRYSDEEKDANIIEETPGTNCSDVDNFNCTFVRRKGDWDNWTPKIGLQWDFSDNAQAYAFWTKGFRAGGFNFRNAKPGATPPFPAPPTQFPAGPTEQEEQNSYEIGLKTQVFDNRLRMNLAYFNNSIDDLQRELNQGDLDVIVLQATINSGDAKIKGVEFEFDAVPTDAMRIYGSVGYLDGRYTRVSALGMRPTLCASYPACPTVVGSELPRLAPWSFSLGGSYDFNMPNNSIVRLQADYGYRDPNFYDDSNTQEFDAQRRLGGSINWISPEDRWNVSLFGKNLRDEANYGNLTSIAGLYTAGPMQKGREYGLQVQYRQ